MDEEMYYQDPSVAPPAGPDQAAGMDPQIVEGVQAFVQSQDPQIAVQVVNMLADMLGLNQAPASPMTSPEAPQQTQAPVAPMGRRGMKVPVHANGGKIKTALEKYREFKMKNRK